MEHRVDALNEIVPRLRGLTPGERLVYCVGDLCHDRRDPHNVQAYEINAMADEAWKLMKDHKILLTQRRLGPPLFNGQVDWFNGKGLGFAYIATGC